MTLTVGSLFSGVGGFEMGFEAAGFRTAWQCEIDQDATDVLERHWPDVQRFRDVREIDPSTLAPVDVVVFGSPCQDMSVAGKRGGLAGERSGLFYEAVRIISSLRPAPSLVIWENVPGALSSSGGRDFGSVLDALADIGAVDICWRVLDAQFFGVAQRRRRVFLVADFGGQRSAEILFESESVRGDSATSGEARQDAPRDAEDGARSGGVANAITASFGHHGYSGDRGDGSANLIPMSGEAVAHCLTASNQRIDAESETFVVAAFAENFNATLRTDIAPTVTAEHGLSPSQNAGGLMVAAWDEAQITSKTNRSTVEYGAPAPTLNGSALASVAFTNRGHVAEDSAHETLPAASHGAIPMVGTADDRATLQAETSAREKLRALRRTVGAEAICQWASRGSWSLQAQEILRSELHGQGLRFTSSNGSQVDGCSPSCTAGSRTTDPLRAMQRREESGCTSQRQELPEQLTRELDRALSKLSPQRTSENSAFSVRRLTPREAERLMGWPDDWTRYRADGREIPDGPRYRMCGNGVVSNVSEWIARRAHAALEAS